MSEQIAESEHTAAFWNIRNLECDGGNATSGFGGMSPDGLLTWTHMKYATTDAHIKNRSINTVICFLSNRGLE